MPADKIYNIQQHPELARLNLGPIRVSYTAHAIARASEKQVLTPSVLQVVAGTVVEVEGTTQGILTKVIVRIADKYNIGWDAVYVIGRHGTEWKVITCYKNRTTDTHKTLNLGRVA